MSNLLKKDLAKKNEPPNGCAKCSKKTSSVWNTNEDTKERDICMTCYQKDFAKKNEPPNGCAKCSNKTSTNWRRNKDTKERDICESCYRKDIEKKRLEAEKQRTEVEEVTRAMENLKN